MYRTDGMRGRTGVVHSAFIPSCELPTYCSMGCFNASSVSSAVILVLFIIPQVEAMQGSAAPPEQPPMTKTVTKTTAKTTMRAPGAAFPSVNPPNPVADLMFDPMELNGLSLARTFAGHTMSVANACMHPSKPIVVTASDDKTWKMWHLPAGDLIMCGEGHKDGCQELTFTPRCGVFCIARPPPPPPHSLIFPRLLGLRASGLLRRWKRSCPGQ